MINEQILAAMSWRYATKKFDASKPVAEKDLETILESARLSASSFGLQPWKFVVVQNVEKREAIRGAAWGQSQVTDASFLIAVLSKTNMDEAYVDAYLDQVSQERGVPREQLAGYHDMILGTVSGLPQQAKEVWNAKQSYIALGSMLMTAALLSIDACPMEGFDSAKVGEILGVSGYKVQALLPIGYRAADDASANYKKIRLSADDAIIRLS